MANLQTPMSPTLKDAKSSLFGAASNMVNSIVGAGIIGIPYAISNAGFVVGVGLLVLVSYLTDKSLRMIVEMASFHPKLKHLNICTYEDLARIPFGSLGSNSVMAGMLVLAYGAMLAYLLVIKDCLSAILGLAEAGKGNFWQAEFPMLVASFIVCLPLSMMRDMSSLEKTSLLSVTADVILVGFVMAYSPVNSSVSEAGGFAQILKDNWANGRLFIGLGVLSTAMACQHAAFIVSNSLSNKTSARWSIVTSRSISAAAVLCLLLGCFGYLGFLDETQGDVLNNFDSGSRIVNAGRTLLAITMFLTYPIEAFVARHVIVALFYNGDMEGDTVDSDGTVVPGPKVLGFLGRRHLITLGIYGVTLLPALIVDDLGSVLSLTGAIGASFIAYIGTGMVYLGVNGEDFLAYCQSLLQHHGCVGGIELAVMDDNVEKSDSDEMQSPPSCYPWWWYVFLFPVWSGIAAYGARYTRGFLAEDAAGEASFVKMPSDQDSDETIGPCKRDYFISIFMIIFGVLATVVGVASIGYVEFVEMFGDQQ